MSAPEWVMLAAHKRADATNTEHACILRISRAPFSGELGASWHAVPLGSVPADEWNASRYVAIPNELDS